jgi:hypothetical protein
MKPTYDKILLKVTLFFITSLFFFGCCSKHEKKSNKYDYIENMFIDLVSYDKSMTYYNCFYKTPPIETDNDFDHYFKAGQEARINLTGNDHEYQISNSKAWIYEQPWTEIKRKNGVIYKYNLFDSGYDLIEFIYAIEGEPNLYRLWGSDIVFRKPDLENSNKNMDMSKITNSN